MAVVTFDVDAFEERAAIMEFDGGLSRFEAETAAAQAQGVKRWEALDAIRKSNTGRGGNLGAAMERQRGEDDMPGVQSTSQEEG